MRILIPFLCLMLLASCHNQNDLKKISELEKENMDLSGKYNSLSSYAMTLSRKVWREDSILAGGWVTLPTAIFETNKIMSINCKLKTTIDSTFSTEIRYIVDQTNDPYHLNTLYNISFTDASLVLNNGMPNYKNKLDTKTNNFILKLKPKGLGWNYYYVKSTLKNDRTGNTTEIFLTDSFYVYK